MNLSQRSLIALHKDEMLDITALYFEGEIQVRVGSKQELQCAIQVGLSSCYFVNTKDSTVIEELEYNKLSCCDIKADKVLLTRVNADPVSVFLGLERQRETFLKCIALRCELDGVPFPQSIYQSPDKSEYGSPSRTVGLASSPTPSLPSSIRRKAYSKNVIPLRAALDVLSRLEESTGPPNSPERQSSEYCVDMLYSTAPSIGIRSTKLSSGINRQMSVTGANHSHQIASYPDAFKSGTYHETGSGGHLSEFLSSTAPMGYKNITPDGGDDDDDDDWDEKTLPDVELQHEPWYQENQRLRNQLKELHFATAVLESSLEEDEIKSRPPVKDFHQFREQQKVQPPPIDDHTDLSRSIPGVTISPALTHTISPASHKLTPRERLRKAGQIVARSCSLNRKIETISAISLAATPKITPLPSTEEPLETIDINTLLKKPTKKVAPRGQLMPRSVMRDKERATRERSHSSMSRISIKS